MKTAFHTFVGLLALMNVIYKLVKCIHCDETFLGMKISGFIYLTIWTTISLVIFYGAYKDWKKVKQF